MHRDRILEKVRAGEQVEIPWLLLANGGIPQQPGLSVDESIKQWAKDNKVFITYEEKFICGKSVMYVIFCP